MGGGGGVRHMGVEYDTWGGGGIRHMGGGGGEVAFPTTTDSAPQGGQPYKAIFHKHEQYRTGHAAPRGP